jgi:transcriptional regulator with XRE-family HTH domain
MGYSQQEASNLIGVNNKRRISAWERGEEMPSGDYLLRLALIYHTPLEELYNEHIEPFKYALPLLEHKLREAKKKNINENERTLRTKTITK